MTPSLSAVTTASATSGRAPWNPATSVLASRSSEARTTSSGAVGPRPTRWPQIAERLNARASDSSTVASRRMPTPVVTPYAGVPSADVRSTIARASRILSIRSGAMATGSPSRATRTTSPSVRLAPVSSTVMRRLYDGSGSPMPGTRGAQSSHAPRRTTSCAATTYPRPSATRSIADSSVGSSNGSTFPQSSQTRW